MRVELARTQPEQAAVRGADGASALMQALYRGQAEVARAVAAALPGLDAFAAAALGDAQQLARLLDRDGGVVSSWSAETARLLVERGADLEAPSRNQQFAPDARPLHSATAGRRHDVCRLLVEAGAEVEARQHGGFTPLAEAAQLGDRELRPPGRRLARVPVRAPRRRRRRPTRRGRST